MWTDLGKVNHSTVALTTVDALQASTLCVNCTFCQLDLFLTAGGGEKRKLERNLCQLVRQV